MIFTACTVCVERVAKDPSGWPCPMCGGARVVAEPAPPLRLAGDDGAADAAYDRERDRRVGL